MTIIITLSAIISTIVSIEAITWVFCIDRHITWLDNNEERTLLAININKIRLSVLCSLLFIIFSWLWFCHGFSNYVILFIENDNYQRSTIGFISNTILLIGIQLTFIHLWSLLARYLCLPVILWPFISKYKYGILRTYNLNQPFSRYCYQFRKWRKYDKQFHYHQSLLINFLDVIPGLVWTKDTKGRFVYSNKAFKVLLNIEDSEILGKTEQDMIDALQKKGVVLSISDNCKKADEIVLKTKKISIYIEKRYINNKFVALNILKAPIYKYHRGKQKIIGTINLGRDMTLDWQEHENIFKLWNSGDKEGAFELFKLHKSRFETLTDSYEMHNSYINLAKEDK